MKNETIKKINTAGQIGYIISIILIVVTIVGMVGIGICTIGAIVISDNDINVKIATNISVNSTGDIFEKLKSFISIDGVKNIENITEEANEDIKVNDNDISELRVKEEDGGIAINAKTNEITISMKNIIIALIAAFVFLGAITVMLYMVKALMKSLKKCETPFSEEVIKNMTRFGTALACIVVLNIILSGFWSSIIAGMTYKPSINLGSILLVAVIYMLIAVFKYGAELQHEKECEK